MESAVLTLGRLRLVSAGIEDRSKAIQMGMRMFIAEHQWARKKHGRVTGAILLVYNPNVRGLEKALTEAQHSERELITSTLHKHLDQQSCLEAVMVEGEASKVRELSQQLGKHRGVKYTKTIAFQTAME